LLSRASTESPQTDRSVPSGKAAFNDRADPSLQRRLTFDLPRLEDDACGDAACLHQRLRHDQLRDDVHVAREFTTTCADVHRDVDRPPPLNIALGQAGKRDCSARRCEIVAFSQ
jgi:hypothetical protein